MSDTAQRPPDLQTGKLRVFLVAAEESGDRLGAALMRALRQRAGVALHFAGVGGRAMAGEGLTSLHAIDDFSIIGISAIPGRLPRILRHLRETLRAIREQRPDVLLIIDSPGYTQWVAWFAHRADPAMPIVNYVSPSVWAWHSSRARSMRRYIAHVLALLPFEPEVHQRLGGPPCTYVGHPLIEQAASLRPDVHEARRRLAMPPLVLAMPGSRSGEIARLGEIFGQTLALVQARVGPMEVVVPTVPQQHDNVAAAVASWSVKPRIVADEAGKQAAFRTACAALAKSGTTTLELAVAGVPMVAAYKVSPLEAAIIRRLVRVPSYILANLVLGENVVPEIVQDKCTPDNLAAALAPLIGDTPERRRQTDAFARLDRIMEIGSRTPATRAAEIVLEIARRVDPVRVPPTPER
jgi:lipid-A-disaccharide synthase